MRSPPLLGKQDIPRCRTGSGGDVLCTRQELHTRPGRRSAAGLWPQPSAGSRFISESLRAGRSEK